MPRYACLAQKKIISANVLRLQNGFGRFNAAFIHLLYCYPDFDDQ